MKASKGVTALVMLYSSACALQDIDEKHINSVRNSGRGDTPQATDNRLSHLC